MKKGGTCIINNEEFLCSNKAGANRMVTLNIYISHPNRHQIRQTYRSTKIKKSKINENMTKSINAPIQLISKPSRALL